ncbi:hypothetical protein N7447_009526 [Penicillium robsamsonii]|uniref:uncharacterized protein n=1 Tax=Penicillium robsamsonii TaxID=1792511 RepID=UPI002546EF2B|nr:uncharacterized protein N7447_009526 [Penicillium robsamsonii]KAJ5817293.1 hypothetical protein N7447_009526 [Penicillium robsamsonii]
MSTLDEALSKQHSLSVWHVYHKGDEHISITPFLNPKKETGFNKRPAGYSNTRDRDNETDSYFVHHPTLLLHDAPRTLRRRNKNGAPICLIKCGAFWRNWTIQFSDNLKDVIDPRGVVRWECRSNPNNTTLNDDHALKGYKVRTWRVWGESGKDYHRQVNARRKVEKGEFANGKKKATALPGAPVEMGNIGNVTEARKQGLKYSQTEHPSPAPHTPILQPAVAEEAVRLNWSSPLSLNPRRYRFEYANIKFSWEGTRDIHPDNKLARWLMPFSHLKLIARLPGIESEDVFVGQYTPSFACRKFGQLWIFNSTVSKLLDGEHSFTLTQQAAASELRDVRETRLYELIMTTAVCMIIGERKKRHTLLLLLTIAAEGGSAF